MERTDMTMQADQADRQAAEHALQTIKLHTGQTITLDQLRQIREEMKQRATAFVTQTKGQSGEQKDLIGAAAYQKDADKISEGDVIGQIKLQVAAAFGVYGPAKCVASLAKFGSGVLSSSCTGWTGFLLKVTNTSTLTDRFVQNVSGSTRADQQIQNASSNGRSSFIATNQPAHLKQPTQPISGLLSRLAQASQQPAYGNTPLSPTQKYGYS